MAELDEKLAAELRKGLKLVPIDRRVDPEIFPHYLAAHAIKAVVATHCLFVTYAFRCVQELATARVIDKHPHTWKKRLQQYRSANASAGQGYVNQSPEMPPSMRVGMIGCGMVGRTVLQTLLDAGLTQPSEIAISTRTVSRCTDLSSQGATVSFDNAGVARDVNVLFIAVLPPQLPAIATAIRHEIRPQTLVVVLAAGLPTRKLRALFPGRAAIHASSVDAVRLRDELDIERVAAGSTTSAVSMASQLLHGAQHVIELAATHVSNEWALALTAALDAALHGLEAEAEERTLICLKAVLGGQMSTEQLVGAVDLLDGRTSANPTGLEDLEEGSAAAAAAAAKARQAPHFGQSAAELATQHATTRASEQRVAASKAALVSTARANLSAVCAQLHTVFKQGLAQQEEAAAAAAGGGGPGGGDFTKRAAERKGSVLLA